MAHRLPKRHPELVSGSVRGEEQERLAESMTIQGDKSQRQTANGQSKKYVFLFFCRNQKLKACNGKKEWDNQRNSFIEIARVLGRGKTSPAQKQNKTRSLTYCYKNERSGFSKQPKSASQNTPFCPFSKGTQNYTNHIALIICALQTIFCVFVFLCFCVFVF